MAETPAQQQYPNLNPYASTNGNGSLENTKNTVFNSEVSETSTLRVFLPKHVNWGLPWAKGRRRWRIAVLRGRW